MKGMRYMESSSGLPLESSYYRILLQFLWYNPVYILKRDKGLGSALICALTHTLPLSLNCHFPRLNSKVYTTVYIFPT